MRSSLRWLGFAMLFDGVWISPNAPADAVQEVLRRYEVDSASVLRVEHWTVGRPPAQAWDLSGAEAVYTDLIGTYRPLYDRAKAGAVGPAEALVGRTRLMDAWRVIPGLDPGLPDELLPSGWPRAEGRRLFTDLYDLLGPLAEYRVRQVVNRHDPTLADAAQHHTTSNW
jgi:phenylacetic acid degradation operon negative regulatory protein